MNTASDCTCNLDNAGPCSITFVNLTGSKTNIQIWVSFEHLVADRNKVNVKTKFVVESTETAKSHSHNLSRDWTVQ